MNGNTRYDVTIKCLSSAQSERIKQNILDRIKYNSNFTDTVKVQLSNDGSVMLRITDRAEAFPARPARILSFGRFRCLKAFMQRFLTLIIRF